MVREGRRKRSAGGLHPSTSDASSSSSHQHTFSLADFHTRPEDSPVPATVHRMSGDHRRMYVEDLPVQPPSPVKRMRMADALPVVADKDVRFQLEEDPFEAFEEFTLNQERYGLVDADDVPLPPPDPTEDDLTTEERLAKVVKPADISLHNWRAKRDTYISAILRSYGPACANTSVCPGCGGASKLVPRFRCRECFGGVLYCKNCIVGRHRENPLHRLQFWNGRIFVKVLLAMLGLRVQMGHAPHSTCTAPEAGAKAFVVLHTNGIHEVAVDFCGCEGALDAGAPYVQLLRAGWFPGTHERPQTCATFLLLERSHIDTLQCKMTMYHSYASLEKLTDNTGNKPPDRYHEWMRICREWFHLELLKHAGRALAYDPTGVEGRDRANGWQDAPPEERFLYTLFLALDACFRLKRRLVSSELRDPDLGSGWAYMVDTGPYRKYLRTVTDQREMESCTGLAALDYANTKFSRGYATTGVGMGVCGRHEFVQPNGVGDLQKGERFSNMDYILACILKHWPQLLRKFLTYDIVCSWMKHLLERLKKLPPHVRIVVLALFMRFGIPKMHIHSHTIICQLLFNLNWILGAAELDAEGIERAWSALGAVAASTRDGGPGWRHDMLNAQIAGLNWQKLVSIVELLRKRRERATTELAEQKEALEEFSRHQAERIPEWRQQVLDFEHDPSKKNPYEIKMKGVTEAEIQLEFQKTEAEDAKRGVPSIHNVSPSSFIVAGLDLEEEQRRVRVQAELKRAGTTDMQLEMGELRKKLNRGIARFRSIQQTYMPVALQCLAAADLPATTLAENVPLFLPSALTPAQRERCVGGLEHIETLLRDAQCNTALVRMRTQLHIKSRLLVYKRGHSRRQGPNTRSRGIVTRNEVKVRLHSEKYQTAWEALRLLNNGDGKKSGWRVLRRRDIRCMADDEDLRKKAKRLKASAAKRQKRREEMRAGGMLPVEEDEDMDWEGEADDEVEERGPENQRQVSWIWSSAGADGTDAGFANALRVEWCKAFARTRRWDEEARLIEEEYRRVGVTLEYEAAKWDARAAEVEKNGGDAVDAEGAIAFARREAEMYRDLNARGEAVWTAPKVARGKAGVRHVPRAVQKMLVELGVGLSDAAEDEVEEVLERDEVDADERGDIEDDEEYIMGGEGDD
ncbi:hypothetical protein C8R46DRAFT_1233533 [Mycena filopes]|nr:hypothetical protein C8R46DRAFT_1233533 [Mycena filopes]